MLIKFLFFPGHPGQFFSNFARATENQFGLASSEDVASALLASASDVGSLVRDSGTELPWNQSGSKQF